MTCPSPKSPPRRAPNTVYLGYGIFNLGAYPLPGGPVMFVSSRDSYLPNKEYTNPNLRLYIMDEDGRNVEPVGHFNIGSALHPTVLMDGHMMFASFEGQGARDERNWGLWAIWPDGRDWVSFAKNRSGPDQMAAAGSWVSPWSL